MLNVWGKYGFHDPAREDSFCVAFSGQLAQKASRLVIVCLTNARSNLIGVVQAPRKRPRQNSPSCSWQTLKPCGALVGYPLRPTLSLEQTRGKFYSTQLNDLNTDLFMHVEVYQFLKEFSGPEIVFLHKRSI